MSDENEGRLLRSVPGPAWYKRERNDTDRMEFLFDQAFTDEHPERGDKLERIRRAIDLAMDSRHDMNNEPREK